MIQNYILTLIGDDRPGLVRQLAELVKEHRGNWEESRLANLRGKFSGILVVSLPHECAEDFERAIEHMSAPGLSIRAHRTQLAPQAQIQTRIVEVVANDRPDILRELTSTLAGLGINVEELTTSCEPAPMSNEVLFRARARISIPDGVTDDGITEALEGLADDLMVEFQPD